MKKTIFITGASSGIGRAAVELFAQKGWQVAATMRSPEKEQSLQKLENVRLFRLDVTQPETITQALEDTLKVFGDVDALVNNAGYGAVGIFEKAEPEQIQRQFDTNVFGLMNDPCFSTSFQETESRTDHQHFVCGRQDYFSRFQRLSRHEMGSGRLFRITAI